VNYRSILERRCIDKLKNILKELRNRHGISQAALAEAVGTTKRTIYSIETENKDIHLSLAHKLASYFRCGVDDIFINDGGGHTTADKAMWFVHVVQYTSEELGKPTWETAKLLEHSGLSKRIISGYDVWHTQGYEYMAEILSSKLRELMPA
jgi:putative transcriptional regulator